MSRVFYILPHSITKLPQNDSRIFGGVHAIGKLLIFRQLCIEMFMTVKYKVKINYF